VIAAIGRFMQWLLRGHVGFPLVVCALALWFVGVSGVFRPADPSLALSAAGLGVTILAAVVLIHRIAVATPAEVAGRVIHVLERYAPLVVINLIVISIFAPLIGAVANLLVNMPFWKVYLAILGSLSAKVLCWLFALAIACVIAVAVMRLLDRAAHRWSPVARTIGVLDRIIIAAAAVYCVWGTVITFNAILDRSVAVEHRGEIIRVWRIPPTGLWWADVRQSGSAGRVARVFVFPVRDGLSATSLAEGQHVRLGVRPGWLRIPWVESMRLDFEHDLPSLVAAVPSAAGPRKWLISALLQDGQWAEAARQTQAYARYYPNDRAFVRSVRATLQQARQPQAAADVGRLIIPVSGTRTR